jgi:hypothetical protein
MGSRSDIKARMDVFVRTEAFNIPMFHKNANICRPILHRERRSIPVDAIKRDPSSEAKIQLTRKNSSSIHRPWRMPGNKNIPLFGSRQGRKNYGEAEAEGTCDQPGLVQGVRNLRPFLPQEGFGTG